MEKIETIIRVLIEEAKKEGDIIPYAYNAKNFIPGESPVYYSGPYWDDEELVAGIKALLVGKWISAGEEVKKFEKEFANKLNQRFGTMVNSGSSANLIMLAGLKKYNKWADGDEIIVSAVGFPTTVSAIVQNNLTPVFIDIELLTLNFNTFLIEQKITSRTRGIFVSPVLGNPPNFDILVDLCTKYKLPIILDCCDSLGSKWNDRYLTSYAIASSHSFYPAHTITTGEGGMITCNNAVLNREFKRLSSWGRDCVCSGVENLLPNGICNNRFFKWLDDYDGLVDHKYVFTSMGYNMKPLDLQGAIGLAQLEKLDEIFVRRNENHKEIETLFLTHLYGKVSPIATYSVSNPVWFGTPFLCADKKTKDSIVSHLENNKIQTRNYFAGNILIQPAYKHLGNYEDYPNANQVLDRVFFVGAAPHYDQKVFDYIEEVLKNYEG